MKRKKRINEGPGRLLMLVMLRFGVAYPNDEDDRVQQVNSRPQWTRTV